MTNTNYNEILPNSMYKFLMDDQNVGLLALQKGDETQLSFMYFNVNDAHSTLTVKQREAANKSVKAKIDAYDSKGKIELFVGGKDEVYSLKTKKEILECIYNEYQKQLESNQNMQEDENVQSL